MIITTKVNMDLLKPGFPSVVHAVQGDQNTRCLEMALYSGGAQWDIPEGTVVSARYCKPDGTKGYYDTMPDGTAAASIQGNTISMLLAPQMMTVPGIVSTQLELMQESNVIRTFSLVLHVEADPAAGAVESEDYINWAQWMTGEVERNVQEILTNGALKGDPGPEGPPGEAAVLTGFSVTYQEGESGETEPSGQWQSNIPVVSQGNYLWTRTVYTFNTGNPVTTYSVSRFGMDGTGAVSSVAGISPDAEGNVPLTASNVGAVNKKGDTMEGSLNMNGQALTGLNAPVNSTDAVNKAYADDIKQTAENASSAASDKESKKLSFYNKAIPISSFVADTTYADYPYRAAVALSGVMKSMIPEVVFSLIDAVSGNFAPVAACYNGGVYIYAAEVPEADMTVPTILCWRGE